MDPSVTSTRESQSESQLGERIVLPSISSKRCNRIQSAGSVWGSENQALRQLSTRSNRVRRCTFPRGPWQGQGSTTISMEPTNLPAISIAVRSEPPRIKDKTPELLRANTETDKYTQKKVRFSSDVTNAAVTSNISDSSPSVKETGPKEDEAETAIENGEKNGVENEPPSPDPDLQSTPKSESSHETENWHCLMKDIMRGNFSKLPPPKTNTIRIFLSSTFSDMKEERTVLFRKAFPDLQEFCKSLRLEFQVVDMRWGVSEHIISDHGVNATCEQQIELCKRNSAGPNFVVIFGDRYGFQPLPVTIPVDDMITILSICDTCDVPDSDLLAEWYLLDQNANPNVYEIQPVGKKIDHYLEHSDPVARKKAVQLWDLTHERLQTALNEVLILAQSKGLMTSDQTEKYFSSVTEVEVRAGILQNEEPNSIAFHRTFTGVTSYDDDMSHKFFDVVCHDSLKTYDPSKRERLGKLREATQGKIGWEKCYSAEWMKTGLDTDNCFQNASYLDRFGKDFTESMKRKITESHRVRQKTEGNPLHDEVLQHARFCVDRRNKFVGQEGAIKQVKDYMTNDICSRKPLVLHGPSGCGKTSLMAVLADKVKDWLGGHTVTIIRFLGTSPDSSYVRSTLLSYIEQICQVFDIKPPEKENVESRVKLDKYFCELLNECSSMNTRGLVLLFDSVDQLNFEELAGMFQWIPMKCPMNVYIICSIASNLGSTYFQDLKKRFSDENQYIEISPLSGQNMRSILENNLNKKERTVTPDQMAKLLSAGEECCWPLYLTIVAKEALKWKSYDPIDTLSLEPTVHSAINKIFHNLEAKYDKVFVSTALGYITVSKGLSEVELEDALSMNDNVLDSVYEFHNPPMEGIIRVPPLLWARVRYDIDDYLVERDDDGATVLSWYHRQFWEAAEQRYLRPNKRRMVDLSCEYSRHLADLFLVETPFKRTIHLTRRNYKIENADRLINLQNVHPTNTRKLMKLPILLAGSGSRQSQEILKEKVLCNVWWIMAKIKGVSFQSTLKDYELAAFKDPEVRFVQDVLKLAAPVLENEPSKLPLELISRLPPAVSKYAQLQNMVAESIDILDKREGMMLRPHFPCLPVPDGNLLATLKGPSHIFGFIEGTSCISWGKEQGLQIWNLGSCKVLRHLSEPQYANDICTSGDRKMIFHTEETKLVGWNAESGNMILCLDLLPSVSTSGRNHQSSTEPPFLTTMCVSDDGQLIAVRINHPEMKVNDHGLVIVDCQEEKIAFTLGKGVHGDRIPVVQFIGKSFVFFACVQQKQDSSKQETHLVRYEISSGRKNQLSLNNKLTVKRRSELTCTQSLILTTRSDPRAIVVACRPDDFIVIDVDLWTLRFTTPKDEAKHAIIACEWLNASEMICLSYNAKTKGTALKIYDADYNIVSEMSKVGGTKLGYVVADKPTVLYTSEECGLAFVGYAFSGSVEIWDCKSSKLIYSVNAHAQLVTSIWFDQDRGTLYTSSLDQTIKQWNLWNSLPQIFNKKQGSMEIKQLKEGRNDSIDEASLGDWTHADGDEEGFHLIQAVDLGLADLQAETTGVSDLVCHGDGEILFTCYENDLPLTWNPVNGARLNKVKSPLALGGVPNMRPGWEDNLFICRVMESATQEAELTNQSFVKVWNTSTGEFLDICDNPIPVVCYGVSRNGRFVALLSHLSDGPAQGGTALSVVDLVTRTTVLTSDGLKCDFLAVSDDGRRVLVITHRVNLRVIETVFPSENTQTHLESKTRKYQLPMNTTLNATAFLNNNRVIIGTTYGSIADVDLNQLEVISRSTKCETLIPEKHHREILQIVLSADEQYLVTASTDSTLKVVDIIKKEQIHQLEGHKDRVAGVDISRDNKFIVSGSRDKTVRLWSLESGVHLCSFDAYYDVFRVRFCGVNSRSVVAVAGRFDSRKMMLFKVYGEATLQPF